MRLFVIRVSAIASVMLGFSPLSARAQADVIRPDSQSTQPARPARLCWRGKPAPTCGVFWITEFSYEAVVASTSTRFEYPNNTAVTHDDFSSRLVWTVGPMFNRPGNRAVGGTLTLGGTAGGLRAALEGRHRWWSSWGGSLDLSAGIARTALEVQAFGEAAYGPTAAVFLVGGDLVEVTARADLALARGRQLVAGTSLGVGLGSYAGAGGTALFGVLVAAAIAALSRID